MYTSTQLKADNYCIINTCGQSQVVMCTLEIGTLFFWILFPFLFPDLHHFQLLITFSTVWEGGGVTKQIFH